MARTSLLLLLVALAAVVSPVRAWYQIGTPFSRNITCLIEGERVLGWPQDICSGTFPDKFASMVAYLESQGINQFHLYGVSSVPADMMVADCYNLDHQEGPGGGMVAVPSEWYCNQAMTFVDAFSGPVCQNKFTSSMLNYNFPNNETTTVTFTMPNGCSASCNCCGPRCHFLTATGPTNPPPESGKKGLFYFFHDYTGDGSWSNSMFHLWKLVDPRNMLIVSPNGRQDDMGYGHWMGTDHFTGYYVNFLNPVTQQMQEADWWQHNCTMDEQFNVLTHWNPDILYAKRVLAHYMQNHDIDETKVYVMGDGNGADMAYHLACNSSTAVSALVIRDAVPFSKPSMCQPRSPIHVLIHQQKTDPATARDLVEFWATANGCTRTSISGSEPDKIVQILYNGTKEAGGSQYFLTTKVPRADGKLVEVPTSVVRNDTYIFYVDNSNCNPGGSVTFWVSENIPGATLDEDSYIEYLQEWIDSTRYIPAQEVNDAVMMGITWNTDSSTAHLALLVVVPSMVLFLMHQLGVFRRGAVSGSETKATSGVESAAYGTFAADEADEQVSLLEKPTLS